MKRIILILLSIMFVMLMCNKVKAEDTTLIIVEVNMITDSNGIKMPELNYSMINTIYSSTTLLNKDESKALCFLSVYNVWAIPVKTAFFISGTKIIDDFTDYYDKYDNIIETMNSITNPIMPKFNNE